MHTVCLWLCFVNSFLLGQNGCHFAADIFKSIFVNEKNGISIWISLKFILKGPIDDKPALVEVMAWPQIGNKPLPELMLTQFTDEYMWHHELIITTCQFYPYISGLFDWHWSNHMIVMQPWRMWVNQCDGTYKLTKTKHNKIVCMFYGICCTLWETGLVFGI